MFIDRSILSIAVLSLMTFFIVLYLFYALFVGFRRCPKGKLLVIYGRKGENGHYSTITNKKWTFIWPIIQAGAYLDLTPFKLEIDQEYSILDESKIKIQSEVQLEISQDKSLLKKSSEYLAGLKLEDIKEIAIDVVNGTIKSVVSLFEIEKLLNNFKTIKMTIKEKIEAELNKLGIKILQINISKTEI